MIITTGFFRALPATLLVAALSAHAGARINQEGRILGALQTVTNAVHFNTPNADAVLSSMQIFPTTSAYNEDVSRRPLLTNSDAIIAQISSDLASNRRTLRLFQEMNFVLTPDSQPTASINFTDYPDESDLNGGLSPNALYPIPANLPIEGWPTQTSDETLAQVQTDALGLGGDRHGIIVQPGIGRIFETWQTLSKNGKWQASNGAIFDLSTNKSRPDGWTSGDAAGLAMFPTLVRFDECERGMVEHACRLVVKRTLAHAHIYPATHDASSSTLANLPAMGQRLRLKKDFVIPSNWTREEKAVLLGLKKYGCLVADNGNFFSISITPDDRWPSGAFDNIVNLGLTNFEVIVATGTNEGPRSPGAPHADAGADQTAPMSRKTQLTGFVDFTGATTAIQWKMYSGPAAVSFDNAAQTNTMAAFAAPGTYTLELSADDGVHTVAYDAVVITVSGGNSISATRTGSNMNLVWTGGSPPYVIEQTPQLPAKSWTGVETVGVRNVVLPTTGSAAFFRIRSQP